MATIQLYSEEVTPKWFPFTGLPDGVTPSIKVGTKDWLGMTLDAEYEADPVVEGAAWYRVTLAGPTAVDSGSAIVCTDQWSRIQFKVAAGGQVDIQPDIEQLWIQVLP